MTKSPMTFSEYDTKQLIEYLPEALFLEDFDGNILDVNAETCELLGYSREELLNQDIDKIVPENRPVFLPNQIDEATRSGKPIETVNLHSNGTKIPVELRGKIIDVEGEKRILVSVRDIIERRNREEKLRQFKMAVQGSNDLMAAVDSQYRYLFANEAYKNLYGLKNEEIPGRSVEELVGKDTFKQEVKPNVDKCLAGQTVEYETTRRHPELGERDLRLIYYPLGDEGEIHGVVKVMRDVTARKQAEKELKKNEERLELALEGTKAGLWDWKVQTGEVVFDERWAGIIGYTLEELRPVTIETWKDLTHREDLERAQEQLEKHFNGETETYESEIRMKHKNGGWVWVLDQGRVVEWNDDGDPVRMVGTHQDITDRREVEEELQEERDKLRKLHDAVDKLQRQNTEGDVTDAAVEVAETMLDFEFCAIMFSDGNRLFPQANSDHMDSEKAPEFKVGEGIAGKTVETGETIWGEDVRKYEEAKPTEEDFRAFISVPIGGIGTLVVVSKEIASFDEEDVELAEILAGHLQEEIKRVRLEEELRQEAIRDPLTGLYNRRYFNETLKKEVGKAKRYSAPIAFLMIDVNRFKEINDRYSHQTGDRVLKEVAKLLKQNVREADSVIRYGGDEFLIMLPETDGETSNTVSRLRKKMEEWNEGSDLLDFPLTLAIGSAHWSPMEGGDAEGALKEADNKMYQDKER